MTVNSGFNLESMMTPTVAATVYAAQENSLYLPGGIIPMEQIGAGSTSLQVPVLAKASTALVDSVASVYGADDFASTALTDTTVSIPMSLYVRRTVLRDAGGVNPSAVGRQLGNAVAQKFDQAVTALFSGFTTHVVTGSGTSSALTVNDIVDAAQTLRANESMGQLYAVLHPYQIGNLIKEINTAAFAGSEIQNNAMRSGFVGTLNGVAIYQSSFITEDEGAADHLWNGLVFDESALRIGIQNNVGLEVGRRPEAVGYDLVASLAAGVGMVDINRGVSLKSTGNTVEI